jgi:hypothetical protein
MEALDCFVDRWKKKREDLKSHRWTKVQHLQEIERGGLFTEMDRVSQLPSPILDGRGFCPCGKGQSESPSAINRLQTDPTKPMILMKAAHISRWSDERIPTLPSPPPLTED